MNLFDLTGQVALVTGGNVTDESQVAQTFVETVAHFGKVDICFAKAGGSGKLIVTSSEAALLGMGYAAGYGHTKPPCWTRPAPWRLNWDVITFRSTPCAGLRRNRNVR